MLRLALAQMRRSAGRLVAAGIAIAIGTAFVAATLLASSVLEQTTHRAITAAQGDADVVALNGEFTQETVQRVRDLPETLAADGRHMPWWSISANGRQETGMVMAVASHPRLEVQQVREGRMPTAVDEVAIPLETAERFKVSLGDKVTFRAMMWDYENETDIAQSRDYEVVGLLTDPSGGFLAFGGTSLVTAEALADINKLSDNSNTFWEINAVAAPGVTDIALRDAISNLLVEQPGHVKIRTITEHAEILTADVTGDTNSLTAVILGFAAISLFVAGLVIANTFQVLVAQRTRALALLRCVGATRGQIANSVLIEAAILGVLASLAGVTLGVLLVQGTLLVLNAQDFNVPLPTTVTVSAAAVIAPLVIGLVVTVASALVPARAATRVAPLAALRPTGPPLANLAGKFRLVVSLLFIIGGAAGLLLGVAAATQDVLIGLAIGVLGGITSFVGVVLGAVFIVPKVVGLFGGLAGRLTGATARIATANTVRNPRRTSATATALLIGVTLVMLMTTGAATARETLASELDRRYPVDLIVGSDTYYWDEEDDAPRTFHIKPQLATAVQAVDGLERVVPIRSTIARVTLTNEQAQNMGYVMPEDGEPYLDTLISGVGDDVKPALNNPAEIDGLVPGTVLFPRWGGQQFMVDGELPETIELAGPNGTLTLRPLRTTQIAEYAMLIHPDDLARLDAAPNVNQLWVAVAADADIVSVVDGIRDAVGNFEVDDFESAQVTGSVVERAVYEQVIDVLLKVLVGMLAVAVVIALVGVANTLSLSVIERRRESALLRALGLTRGRLRAMLAIEGVLIAGVGAVLGVALGIAYGFAGVLIVFNAIGSGVQLTLPWRDIALVLAVAVAAGLIASVLPARSAVRTPPVAALAED